MTWADDTPGPAFTKYMRTTGRHDDRHADDQRRSADVHDGPPALADTRRSRWARPTGGRIEARLARFFLKLETDLGQHHPDGTFIPLVLSRQELADMIGTTIETAIRIMSRWGKEHLVRTEKDGFVLVDRPALEVIALT